MTTPQPALFREGDRHFYFIEFSLASGLEAQSELEKLRSGLHAAREAVSELPGSHLVAFGPAAWQALAPDGAYPAGLTAFAPLEGPGGRAPATQRDLLVYVSAAERDHAFAHARALCAALRSLAKLELDLAGFVYLDSRDLTGFIDGSANPKADDRFPVALIPEGEAGAGGSHVLTQQWVHDLEAWSELGEATQEKIIGRTKRDSIELEGDAMPNDSHVSRTDAKRDGVAQKIYRKSAPYGSLTRAGLYFIAFSCEATRFGYLLGRMFGSSEDGVHDRLTGYSTAVTGSYWFAPSQEDLERSLTS